MTSPSPIVASLSHVTKAFDSRTVLNDISFEVAKGEFVALLGASGSGKTTILKLLLGLQSPDHGEIKVVEARTPVFQEPRLIPSKRVWRNVTIGLSRQLGTEDAARGALDLVGLADRADVWPATLSGGEAQRVALARSLVRSPDLLLLDEPFAALDALTRLNMQQLVRSLCTRFEPGVVLVTHDVEEALLLADRVLVLRDGQISLDVTIDLPEERSLGGAEFDRLRELFLAELGVTVGSA